MNQLKKILIVGAFRWPTGDATAARVISNAKLFQELGWNVDLMAFSGDSSVYECQGFHGVVTNDMDIQESTTARLQSIIERGHNALDIIKKSIQNYELIIVVTEPWWFIKKLIRLCKKNNVKLAIDKMDCFSRHEYPGGIFNPLFMSDKINTFLNRFRKKNTIVISSYLKRQCRKNDNVIVLPPLVDINEDKWRIQKTIEHIPPFDGVTIIYAGHPSKKKDLIDVILKSIDEAVNEGLKIRLLLLGIKDINLNAFGISQIGQGNIITLGRVPQIDVPSYVRFADFTILLRPYNKQSNAGFSTKVVESIASGVTPIVNNTSDYERYFTNGKDAFILQSYDSAELLEVFRRICSMSKHEIKEMNSESKKTCQKKFDFRAYKSNIGLWMRSLI